MRDVSLPSGTSNSKVTTESPGSPIPAPTSVSLPTCSRNVIPPLV